MVYLLLLLVYYLLDLLLLCLQLHSLQLYHLFGLRYLNLEVLDLFQVFTQLGCGFLQRLLLFQQIESQFLGESGSISRYLQLSFECLELLIPRF